MFDFAVVIFGVCTSSLLWCLSDFASPSGHHPSREGDNAGGFWPCPVLTCMCSTTLPFLKCLLDNSAYSLMFLHRSIK